MIRSIIRCPFCDEEFFSPAEDESDTREELRLHIIEHHHITEKRYYSIRNALELKEAMNELCNEMKEAIEIFDEKIDSFRRDDIITIRKEVYYENKKQDFPRTM